jgi:gamma-glutamylputrescine oxidase
MGDMLGNMVQADSGMQLTRPLWVDPDVRSFPALTSDIMVDVAIVGGGICGVACARWLRDANVGTVAIVEKRGVASGASGRNAGFLMAVAPENFPPTNSQEDVTLAQTIWRFTSENQRMIEMAINEFGLEAEYRRLGSIGLAADAMEWNWIRTSTETARKSGLAVELIPREELESEWLRQNYFGGAWYPGNGEIHPAKFVRGLAAALVRNGVQVYEGTSVGEIAAAATGVRIDCGEGSILAGTVIVATNAYTGQLFPALDRVVAHYPVYANHGFQYWRQLPDGRLVLGGWRDMDFSSEVGTDETLHAKIQRQLDVVATGLCGGPIEVEYRWSGIMGFTPDRLPMVGAIPGLDYMYICAGYSGHGLAMAFHCGKVVVDHVLGRTSEFSMLFSPERPGLDAPLVERFAPTQTHTK